VGVFEGQSNAIHLSVQVLLRVGNGNPVTVLPTTERQVRELTRCESDDQAVEVWPHGSR